MRHALEMLDAFRPATFQIEANGADAAFMQPHQLGIAGVCGELRNSDEAAAELAQRIDEISLIESLKRARHDGAANEAIVLHTCTIVRARERIGEIAVVLDQRIASIDDM